MKFIINKKLFDNYENLKVGVIVCHNVNNKKKININDKYNEIKSSTKEKFSNIELAEYPIIHKWREVYKSFGEKKARSSIEALIRRTVNGKEIPNINPIVDIYNMLSLKYELPVGGEDLSKINGDIELTYATGNETFIELGSNEEEKVNENEIVYRFNDTVICRNFDYRESDITKLTENTTDCVLVIESILDSELDEALNELSELIEKELTAKTEINILTKENNEFEIK